jgi:hypothetical protein
VARTSDELVDEVKITCVVAANQGLMTDLRILSICNEEIESKITPMIQAVNQDYFITVDTVPLVSGQDLYGIPERAVGRSLRDVKILDSAGNQQYSLNLISLDDVNIHDYQATTTAFYFMGDSIVVSPTPTSGVTASLQLYYLQRPGRLVPVASCSKVLGVTTDNLTYTTLTVDQVPASFTAGTLCDFVAGKSGNSTLDKDQAITNIAGSQLTFGLINSQIGVGDYVTPQYSSPVLQIPEDCFSYLVSLASIRVLKALGDIEGAQTMQSDVPEKKKAMESLLAPRVSGESIKIVHRNGLLRTGRGWYGPLFRRY